MEDREKATKTEKEPSPRSTVQGEGSIVQPMAITDEVSVVIDSHLKPPPPPPPLPPIRDEFQNSIMNERGESGETGESSDKTKREHKIHRVPQMLRQMETNSTKKYYDPQLVFIGPYHRNKTNLKSFEKFKIQYAREYVKSCEPLPISELYNKVAEVAGEARSCYARGTLEGIDDTTFIEMMFLDGCFILQFIRCFVMNEKAQMEMMKSHDIALVQRDLFLLENQLPLKVLLALKSSKFGDELIDKFVENILRGTHLPQTSRVHSIKRVLLLHSHETPDKLGDLLEHTWVKNLYCGNHKYFSHTGRFPRRSAMYLRMVGIRLRPCDTDLLSFIAFNSTWSGGILTLSKINIDDTTISLLMNMIAYEHCSDPCAHYLCTTNYLCFLDSIIDSANDVRELKYRGIISNFLRNDEEAVNVIHGMAAGLVPDYRNTCYLEVKLRIEEYHSNNGKTRRGAWISEVVHDHFRSPFTVIAVLVALFPLFLTAISTYFTAFRPAKNPSATT